MVASPHEFQAQRASYHPCLARVSYLCCQLLACLLQCLLLPQQYNPFGLSKFGVTHLLSDFRSDALPTVVVGASFLFLFFFPTVRHLWCSRRGRGVLILATIECQAEEGRVAA